MSGLTPFAEAVAWIDREFAKPLAAERVALDGALGRVLAADAAARCDAPPFDRAALDGWAVKAEETLGASLYNPLSLPARPVASGMKLPPGADAVIPIEAAQRDPRGMIEIVEPIVSGADVERRGEAFLHGAVVLPAGRRLGAAQLGLLAEAGIDAVAVIRRPQIRLVVALAEPSGGGVPNAAAPMLAALVGRDGGTVEIGVAERGDPQSVGAAVAMPDADIVLVLGPSGQGQADAALRAAAGRIAMHGVALRPGWSIAIGHAGGLPLFVLPESPADCLWAYELLAGRAVRRYAGRAPDPPYVARDFVAARKIVSTLGYVEIRPVRRISGIDHIEPVAGTGLFATAGEADGFVVVAAASEGVAPGGRALVYLYDRLGSEAADG